MFGADRRSDTRILVVEDEAIVARDLTLRLQGLGYEVTGTAATGAEALALAQSTRPTLVFMDITIQGPMDGVETAHRLISRMDVPIVFLTAHTDTGTIQRAKRARCYGYLIKPFEERELISTIEVAVSRHSHDRPARLMEQAIANADVRLRRFRDHRPEPVVSRGRGNRSDGEPAAAPDSRRGWRMSSELPLVSQGRRPLLGRHCRFRGAGFRGRADPLSLVRH
jgi:CheY-like chemotaxis protein